jgi:hypothetical protein
MHRANDRATMQNGLFTANCCAREWINKVVLYAQGTASMHARNRCAARVARGVTIG